MSAPLIAIVANTTWNIVNFRLSLIKSLLAANYQVLVIAPVDEFTAQLNGIRQVALTKLKPKSKNPINDFLLCRELYQIYQKEQPALILHYTIKPNIFGNFAARCAGISTISTLTGLGYTFLHGSFTQKIIRQLYKMALEKSKRLVFHNPDDLALFTKNQLVKSQQGMVIAGSGVNTKHFALAYKEDTTKFVFLFVGRLLYDKGIEEFVLAANEVCKMTANTEFHIVGQLNAANPAAVAETQLKKWLSNKRIKYHGSTNDVRPFLKATNVFVLPSYREGMPRAVLEAMASGKPIITTDTAGCRDTVEEGRNGWLVPVKDADALAHAMLKIYQLDQQKIAKMGERSRELVLQKFDESIIVAKYLELIKKLLPT